MVSGLLDDDGLMDIGPRGSRTDPRAVTDELRAAREDLPDRNKALGDWAEHLGDGKDLRDRAATAGEECHMCTAVGRNSCQQCGRRACVSHYWVMFGLCRACASEDSIKAWHQDGRPEESNWLSDPS